jgi:sorbitol-6-phosphate 2-dehydrogenase
MTALNKAVHIVPILRMLLGSDGKFPILRFKPDGQKRSASICLAAAKTENPEQISKEFSSALKDLSKKVQNLWIEGTGLFSVIDDTAGLKGRVAGKVIVVTGAAQGVGLEIARFLAAEGARVCLADVNEDGIGKIAAQLVQEYGLDHAIAVKMDVTSSDSVRQAIEKVVLNYGGIDVFISNAGVLKAESVMTQPEKDFDFVTAVNYKGFFLCTQAVAPIMSAQHAACPAATSDIIQINSKSGLQGSNKNAAYAGSKFGGIGLVQSFAMELIPHGIKVNAICPGNFFDGPLWSDPQNGLFVQYLRAGKIPGAKTIEDVRTAYEQKVPMQRGCIVSDVMKAIYYIIDQQYETGQAVPVTGGQVMLH